MALQLLPLPFRFHFLNVRAVFKHQSGESRRRRRAIYRSLEPFVYDAGQQARVIDMRVRQKNEIDVRRPIVFRLKVADFDFGVPLVHPAIHGEPNPAGLNEITGTGDRLRRTEKMNFHSAS